MDTAPDNPTTNKIAPGVSEQSLAEAIEKSGYPLQTVVARTLRKSFSVQEEWSYIDGDSQEQRTLDIHAWRPLYDPMAEGVQPRVRPTLNLLIECKQSVLPYVFFLSDSKPWLPDFPSLAGLAKNHIKITTDDDPSSWILDILQVLGLDAHAFLTSPRYSSTFSKCVRKGQELVLSGSESYNGLVLPLTKSVAHFQSAERPPSTAVYFDAHLVIGIGVVDAPMVGVIVGEKSASLTLVPWVRVTRHESFQAEHASERNKLRAVDIVHRDYLTAYLQEAVMPFATDFATLALKHQLPIANCEAFVAGMGKDSWGDIVSRLQPKTLSARISRAASVARRCVQADPKDETM